MNTKEVAVHSYSDALSLAEILLDNDYVVMISKEEKLWIVSYIWSPTGANRNDVVFMSKDEYEDILFNGC